MAKSIMSSPLLTIFCFGIAIISFGFIIFYAFKNDFSPDILSFFLPSVGAIILSVLLGLKFIYTDAPKNPQETRFIVTILHYRETNHLYGGALKTEDFDPSHFNERGLETITRYSSRNFQGTSQIFDLLKSDAMGTIGPITDKYAKTEFDCLEHCIISWYSAIHNGYWLYKDYKSEALGAGIQMRIPENDSGMNTKTIVDSKVFPENILFNLEPVSLTLPSKGRIRSIRNGEAERAILFESKHSSIEIRITRGGSGLLNKNDSTLTNYIDIFGFKNGKDELTLSSYFIEIQEKFEPFTRFSKEGKLHPKWHEMFLKKLIEAFSSQLLLNKLNGK